MVSSRSSWHTASYRPDSEYGSAGSGATARDDAISQFDTTSRWTIFVQPEPNGLQCLYNPIWITAISASSLSADYDPRGTNDGIFTDGESSGTYTIVDQTSFLLFFDIFINILEAGKKDNKEASQKGPVQEGQKASKEEAQKRINTQKIEEILIHTHIAPSSTSTSTSDPEHECTYSTSCT